MAEEGLQDNARTVGDHLKARLEALGERFPLVGAVHGMGLYLGLEFVRDRQTLEPATQETEAICNRLLDLGGQAQCLVAMGRHQQRLLPGRPMPVLFERGDRRPCGGHQLRRVAKCRATPKRQQFQPVDGPLKRLLVAAEPDQRMFQEANQCHGVGRSEDGLERQPDQRAMLGGDHRRAGRIVGLDTETFQLGGDPAGEVPVR
eukprot:gene66984-91734_t